VTRNGCCSWISTASSAGSRILPRLSRRRTKRLADAARTRSAEPTLEDWRAFYDKGSAEIVAGITPSISCASATTRRSMVAACRRPPQRRRAVDRGAHRPLQRDLQAQPVVPALRARTGQVEQRVRLRPA
jgi:hypothetical protein